MLFHIIVHWKWYKINVKKSRMAKNNQVVILSVVFIFVAITGYIPLVINLIGGHEILRKAFIEVHDKLTFIFLLYLILHVTKRFRWFMSTFEKIKKSC